VFVRFKRVSSKDPEKWELIDSTGKKIPSSLFDEVRPSVNGLAKVKINGKWGYIDKTGKQVIQLQIR
jgi:hypothetical protein